ncbi:MAG: iron ABC transporter substrate-binding protein [Desulfonatronovibrionaceae bacterium]
MQIKSSLNLVLILVLVFLFAACGEAEDSRSKDDSEAGFEHIEDDTGRTVRVPADVEHIVCSGPGCLRLVTYLDAQDMVVAVDDIETRETEFDARPYALANPQFQEKPIFGQFRGFDNPELILGLKTQPDVILKTYPKMGHDPAELQEKTKIPVVAMNYGTFVRYRDQLYNTLRTFGRILNRKERANEVVDFFENEIERLKRQTSDVPEEEKKTCFVGGIAFKGPHGFQSTEPEYPPFVFTNARSVVRGGSEGRGDVPGHTDVAKEKIVEWDPEVLFLDLSTIQNRGEASALYQLRHDPAYQRLSAVKDNRVYAVLPYNWYAQNFGSILADAYFVGKVLYPKRFQDIDPKEEADRIYSFLVGEEVFADMNTVFGEQAFEPIDTRN